MVTLSCQTQLFFDTLIKRDIFVHSHLTSSSLTTEALSMIAKSIASRLASRHSLWCLFFFFCFSNFANAEFSFSPHLTTGVGYTDNVYLDSSDEEYDFITFVKPGVDLNLSGRNGALGISYNPIYIAYTRQPENNFWSHSAILDGWAEIARGTRLVVNSSFLRTEDPISDTDTTVRQGRESYYTNTATIGMVNSFGAEDLVELEYVYYILKNEDETVEDSSYHEPSAMMTYWFSPNRYAVEMEGHYTLSDFDVAEDFEELETRFRFTKRFGRHFDGYVEYGHEYTDFHNEDEDYRVYSPIVGFTWSEQADTRFEASFGYFYRDNEVSEDDDGIVGSVDMAYDWVTGSSISFNGSVGYDRSYFGAENLGFNPYYEVGGSITHLLGRRFTGSLVAEYRRNLYIDEDPDREDAIWRAEVGLAYQALPWLSFNLDYLYRQLDSNINTNDYTENRGMISVTLTPRQPVRF